MQHSIVNLSALLLADSTVTADDFSRDRLTGRQQRDGNGETKSTWALEGTWTCSSHPLRPHAP
jgi:hypothetical protein